MSFHRRRYTWPSLATSPNRSSPPAGLQRYIPYPHIAAEYMFKLVVLLMPGHMWGSLLLQQCPAFLVRLTWIVFVMGGRWPYSWCLVGCCRQDLFNIARNISFFSSRFVSVQVVHHIAVSIRPLPGRNCVSFYPIYPTPPLEQDMTQGQFWSGV